MTNKLSEEIVTHLANVLQSSLGKNLDTLLADKSIHAENIEIVSSRYIKGEDRLEINEISYSGTTSTLPKRSDTISAKFSFNDLAIWCCFPNNAICLWTTIYFDSVEELQVYIDYFDRHCESLTDKGWYNREFETLVDIFFITSENRFALVAMKNDKNAQVVKMLFEWSV